MEKTEIRVLSDLVYELRQDIAKLRERVAVLESRTIHQHAPITMPSPNIYPQPWYPNQMPITCGDAAGQTAQTGLAGF
jgi:hypothetical protein